MQRCHKHPLLRSNFGRRTLVLDDQHADHDAAAVASETPGVAGVSPAPPTAALRAGIRAAPFPPASAPPPPSSSDIEPDAGTAGPCTRLPPAGRTTFW